MFLECIQKSEEECHAIFVCGDLFERRLNVSDAKFAAVFISRLVYNRSGKNCRNIPVYFVHGTFSHDQDQYPIFLKMIDKSVLADVFYIEHVCSLTLVDGKKALFLPQEYDVDYGDLLNDTYDIIVGHGPITSNTKNPCKVANYDTVHSAELLGNISKICVFGHYHGYTDFGNNVFYTGPWLQWKYGEDEPRVFFFCNDNFEHWTVPNPYWMKFETIQIDNPEKLRECLSGNIQNPHRFMIQSKSSDMETFKGIIDSCNSPLVKFVLEEMIDEDDLQLSIDETMDAQLGMSITTQPIPVLTSYIIDKYGIHPEETLVGYESQINKEENKNG